MNARLGSATIACLWLTSAPAWAQDPVYLGLETQLSQPLSAAGPQSAAWLNSLSVGYSTRLRDYRISPEVVGDVALYLGDDPRLLALRAGVRFSGGEVVGLEVFAHAGYGGTISQGEQAAIEGVMFDGGFGVIWRGLWPLALGATLSATTLLDQPQALAWAAFGLRAGWHF